MSKTEVHLGKMIPIEQKRTLELTAQFYVEAMGITENDIGDFTTSWLEYLMTELGQFAHVYDGKLYKLENNHMNPYGFDCAQEKDNGTIEYRLMYHDGGNFNEVLDNAITRMKREQ